MRELYKFENLRTQFSESKVRKVKWIFGQA